jgi:23S rRNA U2552 (ribose-2'-O)-methylase RlmE/FtsJ
MSQIINMSLLFETPPWKRVNIVKQIREEWSDNFLSFKKVPEGQEIVPKITELEVDINELKQKIETSFNDAFDWDSWKKLGNPYEFIYTPSKEKYPLPSISIQNPLSRSYFKLWEMFKTFDVKFPQTLRTAHVCEGPGGFIQCIYDWAEKHNNRIQGTTAMTLRPDHASIPGWKRAANFLKKYPNINVEYGPNRDGNIMNPENQEYFIEKSRGAHIFTADGGFDFSEEYDKQEINMFPLILNSIIIALNVLLVDGICIIKIFDMHYQITKDAMSLLASQFKGWTIYKPATSRPCNSERYFIGMGYRGRSNQIIMALRQLRGEYDDSLESFLLPEFSNRFINAFEDQNRPMLERQQKSIEHILDISSKYSYEDYYKEAIKLMGPSEEWCKLFRIPYHGFNINLSSKS